MEAVNLSQVSQTNFTNKQEVQKEAPKAPEQKKDGAKLLALGAVAGAAVAVAGLAMAGKINKASEVAQDGISKISDIKFFHGQAFSKADGKAFSGIISDKLKTGDTIEMIYKDGVLQKSEIKGTSNILKTFEYLDDNTTLKRVNTSKPGKVREAVYKYYPNNRLADFKVQENGNQVIDFRVYESGRLDNLRKNGSYKSWGMGGKLSYATEQFTNLDGKEVEASIDFCTDGSINKIDCGEGYDVVLNRCGKLVIVDENGTTTPEHVAEVLDKIGIENTMEIITEQVD